MYQTMAKQNDTEARAPAKAQGKPAAAVPETHGEHKEAFAALLAVAAKPVRKTD